MESETIIATVDLTYQETLKYSKELVDNLSKKHELENSLKELQTGIKAEIARCDSNVDSISHKIQTGREQRSILCNVEYDYPKNEKNWVSKDTGLIMRSNAIPTEELQQEILETPAEEAPGEEMPDDSPVETAEEVATESESANSN